MDSVFMFDPVLEPSTQELEESDDDYDFIPVSVS